MSSLLVRWRRDLATGHERTVQPEPVSRHNGGLFFVGVATSETTYAYALHHVDRSVNPG